jgi:hypothetical protein
VTTRAPARGLLQRHRQVRRGRGGRLLSTDGPIGICAEDAVSAAPTTTFELDSSHSPFLSHPDELADAIGSVC